MPHNQYREALLLTITITSLMISIATLMINMMLSSKIAYYETPQGIIERAYNESKEREYNRLRNTTTLYYVIGLSSLTISIGGFGAYLYERREEPEYLI